MKCSPKSRHPANLARAQSFRKAIEALSITSDWIPLDAALQAQGRPVINPTRNLVLGSPAILFIDRLNSWDDP